MTRRWFILCCFLILVSAGSFTVYAQFNPDSAIRVMQSRITGAPNDSLKIQRLNDLAFFYSDYLDDKQKADSLSDAGVLIALMTFRNDLIIMAYNRYCEVNDLTAYQQKALSYALKALALNAQDSEMRREWRIYRNLAETCLEGFMWDKAITYSNSAIRFAEWLKDDTLKAESLLLAGRSLDGKSQRMAAWDNFYNALDLAKKVNNSRILRKCYSGLARFYKNIKLYGSAIECKNLEGLMILREVPVDYTALMFLQYELMAIDMEMYQNRLNIRSVEMVLDYAVRNHCVRLKHFMLALYRKHLIETNNIAELFNLYHKRFPEDLETIHMQDPAMYMRLEAFFNEELKRPDSAEYYFEKAAVLMEGSSNLVMRSNFYNRWGQFCIRQGKQKEAVDKFIKAYDLAGRAEFYPYMLSASNQIERAYRDMGNYHEAYAYSSLNRALMDSINSTAKKEEVIMANINRSLKAREDADRLVREDTERKMRQRRIERNMMAMGIAFMLLLSFVVFRNYRLQKKYNRKLDEARKRSDDLLLNILPYETAEELKHKGSADAKRFEAVTVMFTDFKNFTQASEKMSAEDLVDEIHTYFSEFDRIIARHNIEKIKIIGDSYMCAGGLPVENDTHAYDVVTAAFELQEYMSSQRRIRQSHNKHFFELRIGIHTGPVVAGIVGLKKFAYDIWGDTVNTASRMENSGEVDRVNISGNTYEYIKDRFRCTYRGKVMAKNKGEIDMYFVEPY